MASIANDPGGKRRVLFTLPGGDRKAIRLGKVAKRTAEAIKYRVEQLVEALHFKQPLEGDLAQWVAELEPVLAKKLARAGLISNPAESCPKITVKQYLADWLAGRQGYKPASRRSWRQVTDALTR